jgi:hypothetical protein
MKLALALFVLLATCFGLSLADQGTVYIKDGEYIYVPGILDTEKGVAWGIFHDEMNLTGWDRLYVHSSFAYEDPKQVYAAGFVEGAMTVPQINVYYAQIQYLFQSSLPKGVTYQEFIKKVSVFCEAQEKWIRSQIKANRQDPYWRQVGYVLTQLEGIYAGYVSATTQAGGKPAFTWIQLYLMCFMPDVSDLVNVVDASWRPDVGNMNPAELKAYIIQRDHCSSLVKVTSDLSMLYASHTTWYDYATMNRMLKVYDFPLNDPSTTSFKVSFSSYPATLSSSDDFYITDSGLTVMETTNDIMNGSLWDLVKPQSIFTTFRVMVANRMAKNGKEWVEIYARENSGTYNNQWIVVDYKKFTPKKPLEDGALWVLEQIPGMTESADVTRYLALGYWPSYNIPFFPKIFDISGYPDVAKKDPTMFYETAPRANVFRRDQHKVSDLSAMKKIMRYNDWQHDPLALNDPGNQIASRFDLEQPNNPNVYCGGALDVKVTDQVMLKDFAYIAQSGPTHDQQAVFVWSQTPNCAGTPHAGQPDVWNFDWMTFREE